MRTSMLLVAALAALAPAASAQEIGGAPSAAAALHVQTVHFQEGMGISSATLVLLPIAVQQPLGSRGLLELYASRADGSLGVQGRTYRLSAFTDSWLRASWALGGNAVAILGLNLPTGHDTHTVEEAAVATVMSTELLGFREASWGMGFAATAGLSGLRQAGAWSFTYGASYRTTAAYSPRADTAIRYAPGNEARVRLSAERALARGRSVALGITAIGYAHDRVDGRNLFEAGPRLMGDVSYAFPAPGGTWNLYAADIWRAEGHVLVPIANEVSSAFGDTLLPVGRANLAVVGAAGHVRLTRVLALRPSTELRLQNGSAAGANGWTVSGGADVPLRAGRLDLFPGGRVLVGSLQNRARQRARTSGFELSLVARLATPPLNP
jgi:hypothetical protein